MPSIGRVLPNRWPEFQEYPFLRVLSPSHGHTMSRGTDACLVQVVHKLSPKSTGQSVSILCHVAGNSAVCPQNAFTYYFCLAGALGSTAVCTENKEVS